MTQVPPVERAPCPACGGAGGGPFGRAGGIWDDEAYVCTRCQGEGVVSITDDLLYSRRPGLARTQPDSAPPDTKTGKRKASA